MCTHRVNFYLQYTIYNLLYLISSSEEHYNFCFNNSGTQSDFSGSQMWNVPQHCFLLKAVLPANHPYILSTGSEGEKSSKWKCIKCSHVYLASWILDCEKLNETQGLYASCAAQVLTVERTCKCYYFSYTSYLLREAVRLWWIPSGTHRES